MTNPIPSSDNLTQTDSSPKGFPQSPAYVNKRLERTKRHMRINVAEDEGKRFIFIPKSPGASSLRNVISPKNAENKEDIGAQKIFVSSKEGTTFSPVTEEELNFLSRWIKEEK